MLYSQAIRMADQQDIEKRACLFANRAAALMNLGRDADAVRDCKEVRSWSLLCHPPPPGFGARTRFRAT